jgi:hypothetical protein
MAGLTSLQFALGAIIVGSVAGGVLGSRFLGARGDSSKLAQQLSARVKEARDLRAPPPAPPTRAWKPAEPPE